MGDDTGHARWVMTDDTGQDRRVMIDDIGQDRRVMTQGRTLEMTVYNQQWSVKV